MMPPELRDSELHIITGLDHPLTRTLFDLKQAHNFMDPLPISDVNVTLLVTLPEQIGVCLAFDYVDLADGTTYHGPTLIKSIFKPRPLTHHDQMAYIVTDNKWKATDD